MVEDAPQGLQKRDDAGSLAEATAIGQESRASLRPHAAQPVDGLQLMRVQGPAVHAGRLCAQNRHTQLSSLGKTGPWLRMNASPQQWSWINDKAVSYQWLHKCRGD